MLIGGNFDQVPDKEIPPKPNNYLFLIKGADVKDKKDESGNVTGQQLQVILEIEADAAGGDVGLEKGKRMFDFIDLNNLTRIKRLALSAGLDRNAIAQGVDIAMLPGRRVKGYVTNANRVKDGSPITYANIKVFYLPEDIISAVEA